MKVLRVTTSHLIRQYEIEFSRSSRNIDKLDCRNREDSPQTSQPQRDTKPLLNDQKSVSKKIRLCSTPKEIGCNGIYKRNYGEQSEVSYLNLL